MNPSSLKKPVLLGSILLIGVVGSYRTMNPTKEPSSADPGSGSRAEKRRDPGIPQEQDLEGARVEELLAELGLLTGRGTELNFQALQQAIHSLVRRNPQAAADFAVSLTAGSVREIALHRVAQAWAGRDPGAAARWASGLRNQEERGALLNGVFCEVAQADPAKAVQMAETHDMLSFSPGMTGNLVQQWAARDYDSALRWTEGLRSGAPRDEMFVRLALVHFGSSPEEAARMVSERIDSSEIQEEAAITIVSRWAGIDPKAARDWANTFAAGAFRERALNEIVLATRQVSPGPGN